MYLAHIRMGKDGTVEQTLADHCRNAARYAGSCLGSVGLAQSGTLLGLVHDCGKFKKEFQEYVAPAGYVVPPPTGWVD